MKEKHQLNIRLDENLYLMAKNKCNQQFGIGLTPLIKVFLKSFVTQSGVGFYVGDDDLCKMFNRWLNKKLLEQNRNGCSPLPGPKLRDLYALK